MNIKMVLKAAKKGSIALISILVVTAILLIVVTGMAESHLSVLSQYGDDVANKSSFYGAESCLEETIRRVELDPAFTGTTIQGSENAACVSIVSGGSTVKDIAVTNIEGVYTQQFEAEISITENGTANNALLTSWQKT